MLIYALKSAVVLTLLYLPYLLMLRRESFFRFNRMMLCGILLVSLVLPLCNLPGLSLDNNPIVGAAQKQMIEVGIPISQALNASDMAMLMDEPQKLSWFTVVTIIYIIVAVGLLIMRLYDYIRLRRIIGKDCLWSKKENGISIYCHAGQIPPFSWGSSIVIGHDDYERNGACIIRHEQGHITSGHSWDVLLLTIVELVQWFNPLVWILGQSLQDVHEYQADDYVLKGGFSLDEYRLLLIQKAVGSSPYVLANNFNHSLLKKRITMMCRRKSKPWYRLKALYIVPVAILTLCLFATPEFVRASDMIVRAIEQKICYIVDGEIVEQASFYSLDKGTIHDITVIKDEDALSRIVPSGKGYIGAVILNTTPVQNAQVPASFPGGQEKLNEWISNNIKYPELAWDCGQTGCIYVRFIIEKDGSLTGIQSFDGQENLMMDNDQNTMVQIYGTPVDSVAESEREQWSIHSQEYTAARQSLKAEAERVIRSMPAWIPAQDQGKPVRTQQVLPITFNLQ